MHRKINGWSVVYEQAIRPDGSLFFPKRLDRAFLDSAQRTMGAYIFANQYLNIVIPDDKKVFRKEWIQYYVKPPAIIYRFIAIDPAISTSDTADYTGIIVLDVDTEGTRYVRHIEKVRATATELIQKIFDLNAIWAPMAIGIETVAYQKAIIHFLDLEMRRRNKVVPICEIKPPTDKTKEMRILGLVPFFQFGRILLGAGQQELELELASFPRGAHDDLLDALCYANEIATIPTEVRKYVRPNPNSADYEKWYISQIAKGTKPQSQDIES